MWPAGDRRLRLRRMAQDFSAHASFTPDPGAEGSPVSAYSVLCRDADVTAEIERRGSRFRSVIRRVEDPESAQELLAQMRRQYHDARHHCSAWLIAPDRRLSRSSDDGEPSGTAGAPMLSALAGADMPSGVADLSDVAVVVTRWFGGTLLGTGGLVSAYAAAVTQGLEQAASQEAIITRLRTRAFTVDVPFAEVGLWQNELRRQNADVLEADYVSHRESARLMLGVPDREESIDLLRSLVASLSSGQLDLQDAGAGWQDCESDVARP